MFAAASKVPFDLMVATPVLAPRLEALLILTVPALMIVPPV